MYPLYTAFVAIKETIWSLIIIMMEKSLRFDSLCKVQEKVAFAKYGIYLSSDSESTERDSDETSLTESDSSESSDSSSKVVPLEEAVTIVKAAQFIGLK